MYGATGTTIDELSAECDGTPTVAPRSVLAKPRRWPWARVVALAPVQYRGGARTGTFRVLDGPGGHRWRVDVFPLASATCYLAATSLLHRRGAAVARFGRLIALSAVRSAAAAFVAGWLLARRALRPVAMLTATAGASAQSRLCARRIPTDDPRDERGRLAASFNEMPASVDEAHQAQQHFVSAASCNFREPLTGTQVNREVLQQREAQLQPADGEQSVREAHVEACRLSRLPAALAVLARPRRRGSVASRRRSTACS